MKSVDNYSTSFEERDLLDTRLDMALMANYSKLKRDKGKREKKQHQKMKRGNFIWENIKQKTLYDVYRYVNDYKLFRNSKVSGS